MLSSPQATTAAPPEHGGAAPYFEQLRLVQLRLTDALFDLHASGVLLEDLVAAWLWLDALAASQDA